jgi:hypothetical protein
MTFRRREIELHNERRVGLDAVLPPFPSDELVGYKSELPAARSSWHLGTIICVPISFFTIQVMLASVYCSTLAFWRLIFHRKTILP